MERRIAALEDSHKLIVSKLDGIADGIAAGRLENERRFGAIEGRLSGVEVILKSKIDKADLTPIARDIGALDGKVSNLPTYWQTVTILATLLVGLAGTVFTLGKLLR